MTLVNDPILGAWIIFFCYFAAALACARAFRASSAGSRMAAQYASEERRARDRADAYRASRLFWGLVIALFVFLGINKQIDMQTWITMWGREVAKAQGWYEHRGLVQTIFVLAVALTGVVTLSLLLRRTRHLLPRHVLAFVGLCLLAVYMIVRATSVHEVELAMKLDYLGIRLGWVLELSGIVCVGLCAVRNYWWHRRLPTAGHS